MSELDIAERRVPQDGRFRVRYKGRFVDFRVSIMPSIHGEDAVLRVLDKETLSREIPESQPGCCRLLREELRKIPPLYSRALRHGAGHRPHRSGKTTTLYAAINEIKSDEDKIITIEDPVEYQVRGITQIPVNEKKGPDLRARLALHPAPRPRQDHGRRNPRPGNGADRHPVRAYRPPGLHHRPRQQRYRRHRPLHQHGSRTLQFRFGAQLHPGAASGARDLRELQEDACTTRRGAARLRARSRRTGQGCSLRRRGLPGMLRHRLSWPHRHLANCSIFRTASAK